MDPPVKPEDDIHFYFLDPGSGSGMTKDGMDPPVKPEDDPDGRLKPSATLFLDPKHCFHFFCSFYLFNNDLMKKVGPSMILCVSILSKRTLFLLR